MSEKACKQLFCYSLLLTYIPSERAKIALFQPDERATRKRRTQSAASLVGELAPPRRQQKPPPPPARAAPLAKWRSGSMRLSYGDNKRPKQQVAQIRNLMNSLTLLRSLFGAHFHFLPAASRTSYFSSTLSGGGYERSIIKLEARRAKEKKKKREEKRRRSWSTRRKRRRRRKRGRRMSE